MLNQESRKYFNRAFVMSGSAFVKYILRKNNHVNYLREYLKITDMNEMIEFLKNANAFLIKRYPYDIFSEFNPRYVATIENAKTSGAFMSKMPDELYRSDDAPKMDTMFSFTEQVC